MNDFKVGDVVHLRSDYVSTLYMTVVSVTETHVECMYRSGFDFLYATFLKETLVLYVSY